MEQAVKVPNPVDVHVGGRVRLRRTILGMTQTGLGDAIGLTFQQVQKYERGLNRIGSSRLYDLARVLDVPINFFFDDMPAAVAAKSPAQAAVAAIPPAQARGQTKTLGGFEPDLVSRRETLELVRAYYRIPDLRVRRRLFEMVKALAAASEDRA